MKNAFQNSFAGVHKDTYWGLAIPWYDETLIGCFKSYNLVHIGTFKNDYRDTIEYYSGISAID